MKKNQVQIGGTYVAKVSGQLASVRIDAESPHGGWDATNVETRRKVRIKSPQRLRRAAAPKVAVAVAEARLETTTVTVDAEVEPTSAEPGQQHDPAQCSTAECNGAVAMTYLGRPLCQACWDKASEAAGDAERPTEKSETPNQENDMSKKKTTKTAKAPAKTKGAAKMPAPKAKTANEPKTKPAGEKKPRRLSALDAAAQVLAEAKEPMGAQDLITAMAEKKLWTSPAGKTPHATLYAAMVREIDAKGKDARFKKVDRGMFAAGKVSQ